MKLNKRISVRKHLKKRLRSRRRKKSSFRVLRVVLMMVCVGMSATVFGNVIVTEFLNNPDGEDRGREWIELYNDSSTATNLQDWELRDSDGDLYTFGNVVIGANDFLIVSNSNGLTDAQAKAVFEAEWNGGVIDSRVIGGNLGNLANGADEIPLVDGEVVLTRWSLAYSNDENLNSTSIRPEDFGVTSFGTQSSPGVVRNGFDNLTPGFLGYESSENWSSTRFGDISAIQDLVFLNGIGLDTDFYDNVQLASRADVFQQSFVIPEPTALGLFGLASLCIVRIRKRRC